MEVLSDQELRERAALVAQLGLALNSKDVSLDSVLKMIKSLIARKAWTHFKTKVDEEVVYEETSESFMRFIQTDRPNGLGTTVETVERVVKEDEEALRAFRKAKKLPRGGDYTSQDREEQSFTSNRSKALKSRNTHHGTTKSYGLEVLHDRYPDLYVKVQQGELSTNRAMILAGERKPARTFPIGDMQRLASALKRLFDEYELRELIMLLSGNEDNETESVSK